MSDEDFSPAQAGDNPIWVGDVEYIRSDLVRAAEDAACQRGYARAVEDIAQKIVDRLNDLQDQREASICNDIHDAYGEGLIDEAQGLLDEIRALTPPTPAMERRDDL